MRRVDGQGKSRLRRESSAAVAACRQRHRVRFTTAAALVNDLVEAQHHHQLTRVTNRWAHCDLVVIDELGYVALAEVGAELLFQLIAERAEKAAVIATTNLPFSEWTTVFPNARLCQALLDRLTDRAHIIETGTESYRFRRTLEQRQKKGLQRSAPSPPRVCPGETGDHPDCSDPAESQCPLPAPP
ncbi:MAG: ATP-binding protein [Candidatus Dormibacterales bacterium]